MEIEGGGRLVYGWWLEGGGGWKGVVVEGGWWLKGRWWLEGG